MAQTAQTFSPEDKKRVLTSVVQLATKGATVPKAVSNFVKMVNGEKVESLAPYAAAGELAYLSILCGFVRAVEKSENAPDMVLKLVPALDGIAEKALHGNPDKPKADVALLTFKNKLTLIALAQVVKLLQAKLLSYK